MIVNAASMICDKNKEFEFKRFSEECIKLFSSENGYRGLKGLIKHKIR